MIDQAGSSDAGDAGAGGLDGGSGQCTSAATVTGTVGGAGVRSGANAAYVKSAFEYIFMGQDLVPARCCVDLAASPATLSLGFSVVRAGTHSVATLQHVDSTRTGVSVSMDTASGGTYADSGTVTISKTGERWSGTFTLTFPSAQQVTGSFETGATALTPCR